MKFTNTQFGDLEYDDQYVVLFPQGLIGFEQYRKFIIIDDVDSEPFRWLVSLESADLSFPMLDPSLLVPDYRVGKAADAAPTVFVVATFGSRADKSSVNLRAPILFDNQKREGQQVILDDESLPFTFPRGA